MAKKRLAAALDEKKAAIYKRVSTQYQVDRASLPVQESELINYCKYALDIDNYEIFEDAGYSAKNTDRPDYQRMMARIRTGEFTHLVVWKIDRISRNLLDFAAMYSELKDLGVTFVSKNEQFDTSNAMGEAMLKIILVFAELERNMTSERVTQVLMSRAKDGIWNGGRPPYAYSYDKPSNTFSVVEDEKKVVLFVYDTYEATESLLLTTKAVNEKGIVSRNGKPWSPTTIRNLLANPFYSGTLRYNYRDITRSKTVYIKPEDEWVLVEDHHEAIVSKERQARVMSILESKRRGGGKLGLTYQRKNVHIFGGLLKCGCCGSSMVCTVDTRERKNGVKPSIYACSRRRRFNDCQNKYITDLTIGPFIFNFIANMIKASNSFGKTTGMDTLQKKLLRGEALADVDHIGEAGLSELYNHFRSGFDGSPFEATKVAQIQAATDLSEREILLSERRRLDRALSRLKTLYLYSEEAMAEKDYVLEKKELTGRLEETDQRLAELDAQIAAATPMSDEEFMAKASYFILSQELQGKREVDYPKFITNADPQILKNFIKNVTTNFCIKNGRVTSILFKNGIELQFFYKPSEDDKSPETA